MTRERPGTTGRSRLDPSVQPALFAVHLGDRPASSRTGSGRPRRCSATRPSWSGTSRTCSRPTPSTNSSPNGASAPRSCGWPRTDRCSPPPVFTRSGGVGATIGDQVADDKVLAQLAGGATLVLQALHRTWPPLIRFGTELAVELGHPVQINAYITPPENQGFSAHYDTHDVFVLQVAGSKRWTIHAPVIDDPLPDQTWDQRKSAVAARATETPLIDTVLQPGDALYLPRGFLHSAVAQGEVSIHLTVGVHPLTAYDLARELITAAASDRDLRRSLPLGVDVTDISVVTAHLQDAAKRLASVVDGVDQDQLAAVARTVGRQQVGATRPAPLAPLRAVGRSSRPRCTDRAAAPARFAANAAGRPGTESRWRSTAAPSAGRPRPARRCELALSGEVFQPRDCVDLDPEEQLVVARRLLREGIVVPATTGPVGSIEPDRRTG